jgi:hypothetical protein
VLNKEKILTQSTWSYPVNPLDLDALAERSGLRLPALRHDVHRSVAVPVIALSIAIVVALGVLSVLAVRLGGVSDQRDARIRAAAPRLCAARFVRSSMLFIESGDMSASIACGNPDDRVVSGHIEVAYP